MKKPRKLPCKRRSENLKVLDAIIEINEIKMGQYFGGDNMGGYGLCRLFAGKVIDIPDSTFTEAYCWFSEQVSYVNKPFCLYLPNRGYMTRTRKITLNKIIKHMKETLNV